MKQQATDLLTRLQRLNKQQILDRLKEMDPTLFEHLVALLFEIRGYEAETVGRSGDEGVDVRLRQGKLTAVAQCKRYADSVGQPTIRDLYGTMLHNKADEAYLVTTAQVTRQAKEWAFGKPIKFVDGFTLTEWILEAANQPQKRRLGLGSLFGFGRKTNAVPESSYTMNAPNTNPSNSGNGPRNAQQSTGDSRNPRFWFWPLVVLGILLFGFAVGIAYNRLSDRWDTDGTVIEATPIVLETDASSDDDASGATDSITEDDAGTEDAGAEGSGESTTGETGNGEGDAPAEDAEPTATPVEEPTAAPTEEPTATSTEVPTEAPTQVPTATWTPVPTLVPTATWTPIADAPADQPANSNCTIPVDGEFQQYYTAGTMGCPTGTTGLHWAAWQAFERGYLLWRSDSDAAYALYGPNDGTWFEIPERWDGTTTAPRGEPPSTNLAAPERGFGYVWGIRNDIFENLGWATDIEKGFCALIQPFEQGYILQSIAVDSCTAQGLFNQARSADWQPITIIASGDGRFIIR